MRIGLILLINAILISCGPSIPKDVLPPDKMKLVLWDIMQADELAEYNLTKDSSFNSLEKHIVYYQDVLTIHKVKKVQFSKSLAYYSNNPELFKVVLDSLQSFGERLQKAPPSDSSIHFQNSVKSNPDSLRKKQPVLQPE